MNTNLPYQSMSQPRLQKPLWLRVHIDPPLLIGLLILIIGGLFILYSAGNESLPLLGKQGMRFGLALGLMFIAAQIPPHRYLQWTPWLFLAGLVLLAMVLVVGYTGKGAQRWLNLGLFRFQPSELMKLAVPLMLARYLKNHALPPKITTLLACCALLMLPVLLIAKQPDLGTALIIAAAGICVLLFAGISWRLVGLCVAFITACIPVIWHFMHPYQRARVLTFLNPERDPLGAGYHIIQSKIAIGSGGVFGEGWLNGTQSHLQFLPEHATDFIFAVAGEEFGLIGATVIIMLFIFIAGRGLYIALQAQDTFTRLVAAAFSLTFFISTFINIGMVTGLVPVVGLPLPLVSYGGTSIVTLMIEFGIIMSIHTHRSLVSG